MIDPTPRLAPGVKLRHDPKRGAVLLGPERILELDETAQAIVAAFDGNKRVSEIAAALAKEYDANADDIRADIEVLLKDLTAKGYVKP
ncbi:MAG: pyrroloquinoline quinone biosynthesis peptide chaperone PqqD [Alphaproteobacteria bacterium]|nr:pyrroloquinoline quinone biosynthesis peptide chaperone PqqD [Alphaproteobacteria bacterium]